MKISLVLLSLCFVLVVGKMLARTTEHVTQFRVPTDVQVRRPELADLPSIYVLDEDVSYEHFVPVYEQLGKMNPLPASPKQLLTEELRADVQAFRDAITGRSGKKLFCAFDKDNACVGLVFFSSDHSGKQVTVDLLLVSKTQRGKGIGKKLVEQGLAELYPHVQACMVFPFKEHNDAALRFYENLGFVCQGAAPAGHPCALGKFEELYLSYRLDIAYDSVQSTYPVHAS